MPYFGAAGLCGVGPLLLTQHRSNYEINPVTVPKACKELARDGVTVRLRGEELMVREGVREVRGSAARDALHGLLGRVSER
jgi:DNA-binding transcriptional regulator YhcF (GntR family)